MSAINDQVWGVRETPRAPEVVPLHATLAEALAGQAARSPERTVFKFLLDGEQSEDSISFAALDRRARTIADALRRRAEPGERAVLVFEPGLPFITAFYACLYAGIIAVPAFPPDPRRLEVTAARLDAMAADAGASLVLATTLIMSLADEIRAAAPALARLEWLAVDRIEGVAPAAPAPPDPDALAYIQYTSGSTGTPKGVMVSHQNLVAQAELIRESFEVRADETVVSWLPLYHDMGLVGHILAPIHTGWTQILMSPIAFLQRPARWLRAISRYRAAVSGAPNFAYELCTRKVAPEVVAELDLSAWRLAYSGAEPIRAETLDGFTRKFAPAGFRRESFYPCWGLAEGTLQISGSPGRRRPVVRHFDWAALERHDVVEVPSGSDGAKPLVGCGQPVGHVVTAVDPDMLTACPDGRVGELWVRGPCVTLGYWERPALTAATFDARLAEGGEGPFLRTGDLGFVHEGSVFVVGRLKDVIIIRGRNLVSHDVEATVERGHPGLRPGCGAAVPVDLGYGEALAVIQEVADPETVDVEAVSGAIRSAVLRDHGIDPALIALLPPRAIPKTTSGKIRRRESRAALLAGSLPTINPVGLMPARPQQAT